MDSTIRNNRAFSTSKLVKISILAAIGYILMFIAVPIPALFPDFLKIDIRANSRNMDSFFKEFITTCYWIFNNRWSWRIS